MNTITLTLSNFNHNGVLADVDEGFLGLIIVEAIRNILAAAHPQPQITIYGDVEDPLDRSIEYLCSIITAHMLQYEQREELGELIEAADEDTQLELEDENYNLVAEKLAEVINEIAQANAIEDLMAIEPFIDVLGMPKYPSVSASYYKNKVVLCLM